MGLLLSSDTSVNTETLRPSNGTGTRSTWKISWMILYNRHMYK